LFSVSTSSLAADCIVDFTINDQWNEGFTANVRVTNNQRALTDWTINWTLPNGQEINQAWNVLLGSTSGNISGTNESYNGNLALNQTVEFGYTALFSSPDTIQTVPDFRFNGELCDVSAQGGGVNPGMPDQGEPAEQGAYSINNEQSLISFVTTKKVTATEANRFDTINASIDSEGNVRILIDLDSVNTNISVRDQNIRQYLFETDTYPIAEITATLAQNIIIGIAVGSSQQIQMPVSLTLHGVTQSIDSVLLVQRLSENKLVVGTLKPIIINADDYGLMPGIDMLKNIASLTSISMAIPVDVQLVFEKQQ